MSDLMTDEEQIIWFLREFENAEDEQLEDCELEIYGEDDQGREGTCTISVQEIAKKAADFIEKLTAERDAALANKLPEDYIAVPESAWHMLVQCEVERDALAATVEALKATLEYFVSQEFEWNNPNDSMIDDINQLLGLTPQQHLRDIQAEVVEKYYYMGWEHSLSTKADDGDHYGCGKRLAKEFAARVKASE